MKYARFSAGLFLVFAGAVLADDFVLETIDVSATRTADVSGGETLLDEKTVRETGAVHPAELMGQVPGLWISRGGGQENLTALRSAVFTGPGSCGEFLFTEDGVPVRPSGFCNVNQFMEINTEQAGGIEVLGGAQGGSYYGINAIHGVINTQSLPLEDRHSVRVEGGPDDYARMLWEHGDADGYLALNTTHDGGYVDSSGYDQQKISWKQRQDFSAVSLTHYMTAVHLDQQSIGYLEGQDAYKDDDIRQDNTRPDSYRDLDAFRYVQAWDWQAGDYHYTVKPYFRHTEMDFTQQFVFPQTMEKNGHNSAGMQWLFKHNDFGWGSWQGGADIDLARAYTKEWQETPATPVSPQGIHYNYNVNMLTSGLWQDLVFHIGSKLDAQFGARVDRVFYDYDNETADGRAGKFMRPADRTDGFTLFSPRVGLVYTDQFDNEWYASAATGKRAPQTAELYRLQGLQTEASIGEVTADSGEIGWRGNAVNSEGAKTSWNVALYDMHEKHVIIRNASNVYSDDGKVKDRGIEITLEQNWSTGWFAGMAATYAEHRYNSDVFDQSNSVNNNIMDTAPRTLGSAHLGWQQYKTRAELEWQHMGDYYLDPEHAFSYEGHDLLHLRTSYLVAPAWTVYARLMNVTNVDYAERADVTAFPAKVPRYFVGLPRSLYLGVEWDY
ncbi:MAG TPA: TonB-dependent receptor [Pseudomonadales bacterium]|nr:TonB-dependent receptor [Pseudomonadales bacterium]